MIQQLMLRTIYAAHLLAPSFADWHLPRLSAATLEGLKTLFS